MPRSPTPGRDGRWSSALVGLVAVLGIVVTAVLATAAWAAHACPLVVVGKRPRLAIEPAADTGRVPTAEDRDTGDRRRRGPVTEP